MKSSKESYESNVEDDRGCRYLTQPPSIYMVKSLMELVPPNMPNGDYDRNAFPQWWMMQWGLFQ